MLLRVNQASLFRTYLVRVGSQWQDKPISSSVAAYSMMRSPCRFQRRFTIPSAPFLGFLFLMLYNLHTVALSVEVFFFTLIPGTVPVTAVGSCLRGSQTCVLSLASDQYGLHSIFSHLRYRRPFLVYQARCKIFSPSSENDGRQKESNLACARQ